MTHSNYTTMGGDQLSRPGEWLWSDCACPLCLVPNGRNINSFISIGRRDICSDNMVRRMSELEDFLAVSNPLSGRN